MDEGFIDYLVIKNLSIKTIELYGLFLEKFEELLEKGNIKELSQDIINVFLSSYPHGVARAFMRNYLQYYKVDRKITIPMITGRREKKQLIPILETHLNALREHFYDKRADLGLIFDLSYYGALRREEVIKIRMIDINIDELSADPNKPVKLLIRGKGKRERFVIIPKLLLKTIILYVSELEIKRDDVIFKISGKRWWTIFNKACMDLGMIKLKAGKIVALYHPHSIRHYRASEWSDNGLPIEKIQNRLGHSSISTTQIYIHPETKKMMEEWGGEYD